MTKILYVGTKPSDEVFIPHHVDQGDHHLASMSEVSQGLSKLGIETTLSSWGNQGVSPDYSHLHLDSFSVLGQPGGNAVAELLKTKAEKDGLTVSYDPNLSPRLMNNLEETRSSVEEIVTAVDLVKVSEAEIRFLYPEEDRRKIAEKWLGGRWERRGPGAQIVVVTRGEKGAELFTPWLPAPLKGSLPDVEIVDTLGAENAFLAGLLVALDENRALGFGRTSLSTLDPEELQECLDFALAACAIACAHPGTYAPECGNFHKVKVSAGGDSFLELE